MKDLYGREIDYMRISITDRCNLRCRYCMPESIELLPMQDVLTYEEIEEICRIAAASGVRKLKVTGGEPLVRRGCADLIGRIKQISGIEQVTLTTNGVLLEQHLPGLMAAGLDAVNISLDTLDPLQYRSITGHDSPEAVLRGLHRTVEAGIPTKVNAVLMEDNAAQWRDLVRIAQHLPVDVRFIEMMPIGYGSRFRTFSNRDILTELLQEHALVEEDPQFHGNGPAKYYRIPGYQGSIGFISAIHGKFCSSCNRMRLTSTGKLKPCLCYNTEVDMKAILRSAVDPEVRQQQLAEAFSQAVTAKPQMHCFEERSEITETKRMVQIGG